MSTDSLPICSSTPRKIQHSSHKAPPWQFGASTQSQLQLERDNSPKLSPKRALCIQQIVGTIMCYYARAIDLTTLVTLVSITSEQAHATEQTEQYVHKLLNYLHTHKDTTFWYYGPQHHPLQCILPLWTKNTCQTWGQIFSLQPPPKQIAHTTQWSHTGLCQHLQIYSCISSRSVASRSVLQHPRRQNTATSDWRTVPCPTAKPSLL